MFHDLAYGLPQRKFPCIDEKNVFLVDLSIDENGALKSSIINVFELVSSFKTNNFLNSCIP